MLRTTLAAALAAALATAAHAQHTAALAEDIATPRWLVGGKTAELPLIRLGTGETLQLSFDAMSHRHRRFTYSIEHCGADWETSPGIFPSEYAGGFTEGLPVEDSRQSEGTVTQYTHYSVSMPNADCAPAVSGNYRLTVTDDESGQDVLRACFMVAEDAMAVEMEATANTDAGFRTDRQQVSMRLGFGQLRVTSPQRQVKTAVLQNADWSTAEWPQPTYATAEGMAWEHSPGLIFHGGNEYRKFELLDTDRPSMGVERTEWDGSAYHAFLWPAEPRPNYSYDEDANGAFYIRNGGHSDDDTGSEYSTVHFTLPSPPLEGGAYIAGRWAATPQGTHKMEYDSGERAYKASLPLKQGYYSYKYVSTGVDGKPVPVPSEGDFYQAENTYHALVYYRGPQDRADRLVAVGRCRHK